jgi:hypothetical protein
MIRNGLKELRINASCAVIGGISRLNPMFWLKSCLLPSRILNIYVGHSDTRFTGILLMY